MTDDRAAANSVNPDDAANPDDAVTRAFQIGQQAFERGQYRTAIYALEGAIAQTSPQTILGGDIQMLLVSAYEGAGDRTSALNLCRTLTKHVDLSTRQQAKQLLYILEAPKLNTRPDWFVEIPDLSKTDESKAAFHRGSGIAPRKPSEPQPWIPEPVDPQTVNLRDERFIWVALGAIALVFMALAIWAGWA